MTTKSNLYRMIVNQQLISVHDEAEIHPTVQIGHFTSIAKDVIVGEDTWIGSNVTIMEGVRIGRNCKIFPGAVIGAIPQDLKYKGESTHVYIGDNTTIRECVTINKGTAAKNQTVIGDNCLLMAYCHVAHDCIIGNHVIISNATQLAGEVVIDDYAIISGGVLVHQFTRIGSHVMIQGGARITKDVPPYITAGREPVSYAGINSIGLRRRGFSPDVIQNIQNIYRCVYMSGLNVAQAVEQINNVFDASNEKNEIVSFIENSSRGIIKGYFV